MASSKLQLLHVLPSGKLYLHTISLALLTGFTFSIILPPVSLHPLFPAMESLFLVSLPHLWQASLSWFTPPCLFLLLNGIIVILTATSGSFSSPPSSELTSNSLVKMGKNASNDGTTSTEPLEAVMSPSELDISIDSAALQMARPSIVSFSEVPLCYHCLHTQDAAMAVELKLPKDKIYQDEIHDANPDNDAEDIDDDDVDGDENIKEMGIIPQEAPRRLVVNVERPKLIDGNDDPAVSSWTWEEASKAGSEPSTPKFSSSAMKDSMRRSMSLDSAPHMDDIDESPEYKLSEEAFRKRIEDYIFKVNAKLRSETRFIN